LPALQPIEPVERIAPRRRPTPPREGITLDAAPATMSRVKRAIFLALAGVFFGLAVLGALLPVLPSTPFLLLTSYFLLRCWPQMNERLLRSRLLGTLLRDWQERGGVARKVKAKAICMVTVIVGLTIAFVKLPLTALALIGLLAMVGIIVVARLPEPRDR
jgi:uncharacterized membrane protein YbaN (DUF454 family)